MSRGLGSSSSGRPFREHAREYRASENVLKIASDITRIVVDSQTSNRWMDKERANAFVHAEAKIEQVYSMLEILLEIPDARFVGECIEDRLARSKAAASTSDVVAFNPYLHSPASPKREPASADVRRSKRRRSDDSCN